MERPDLDILFVTGDIIGHGLSQDLDGNYSAKTYETLLQVHTNFSNLAAKYIPNTIILPTIGNNDFRYRYQGAPTEDYRKSFFGKIFDLWFKNHPANAKALNLDLIYGTFIYGGYYRVNLP